MYTRIEKYENITHIRTRLKNIFLRAFLNAPAFFRMSRGILFHSLAPQTLKIRSPLPFPYYKMDIPNQTFHNGYFCFHSRDLSFSVIAELHKQSSIAK